MHARSAESCATEVRPKCMQREREPNGTHDLTIQLHSRTEAQRFGMRLAVAVEAVQTLPTLNFYGKLD